MIRLSSSEISLEGLRTSPERTRSWDSCDIRGRPPERGARTARSSRTLAARGGPCNGPRPDSRGLERFAVASPAHLRWPRRPWARDSGDYNARQASRTHVPGERSPPSRSIVSDAGLVLGLIAAGTVDLALLAALAALFLRRPSRPAARARTVASLTPQDYRGLTALDGDESGPDGVPIAAYDRVVRIAGWTWILSTGLLVLTSGLWTDREGAILPILGIAGLFVLVAHDILPAGALGRAKYVVEGAVSIVFVTLIVLLTGSAHSPFFFAFALIVVGAALVVPPAATVALASLAGVSYLVAVVIDLPPGGLDVAALDLVGVNLVSLFLLAFVATV